MRIAIEIGTHTARAAYLDATGAPRLIRMPDGGTVLPALARQTMHGLVVGAEAAQALVGNAETTVQGCTRLMGRAGTLPAELIRHLPYAVRDVGGEAVCNLLYAEVRAGEIYGRIARALVDAAQAELGQPIDAVALVVPASAEDRFRVQARAALEAQGIRVARLINQPTAALLGLGRPDPGETPALTAVVACSGGATEVSIAEWTDTGVRVRATAVDPLLGGDDMAWEVAERLNERFRTLAGVDVLHVGDSRVAAQGLRNAAEEALRHLSLAPQARLVIDHGGGFGRDLVTEVQRLELDTWLTPHLERTVNLCKQALKQSGAALRDLGNVVLIGEWANLPAICETVARVFKQPVARLHTRNAETLAVFGAALALAADAPTIWDVTPYPLGINCYYGERELLSPIIKANTPIPTPAVGAPGAYTDSYQTRFPDQTSVTLDILQYRGQKDAHPQGAGRVTPEECEVLGSWSFTGLSPARGKAAAFTVTFAIDADGILQLYAHETATGHSLTARVDRGIG